MTASGTLSSSPATKARPSVTVSEDSPAVSSMLASAPLVRARVTEVASSSTRIVVADPLELT